MKRKWFAWLFLLVVSLIFISCAIIFVLDGYRIGQPNVGWSCAVMFFLMLIVVWAKLLNEDKKTRY